VGRAPDVVARHPQLAGVRPQQGGHGTDEGRLAGPVGAEDREDLPRLGDQVQPVEGHRLAEPLAEAHGLDGRCHCSAPFSRSFPVVTHPARRPNILHG
jgi:hypothetical protein